MFIVYTKGSTVTTRLDTRFTERNSRNLDTGVMRIPLLSYTTFHVLSMAYKVPGLRFYVSVVE